MKLQELNDEIKGLTDAELLSHLDCVSTEIKRRNTILGPAGSDIRKENIEAGLRTLLDVFAAKTT